jgi:hypothetical protein
MVFKLLLSLFSVFSLGLLFLKNFSMLSDTLLDLKSL